MEQQASSTSSPQHTAYRETEADQSSDTHAHADPSTSDPTLTNDNTHLANSEPYLRFPRPVGNRHLVNWISTSNPDIMRLTTSPEDSGLSESTYELVAGIDGESQDGQYNEYMGDSVDSLDQHQRSEDTYSLVGTEHTYDDESVAGDFEAQQLTPDGEEDAQHDTLTEAAKARGTQTLDFEHENHSQGSLDYTHHSLSTPSIPTPEASKIIEKVPAKSNDRDLSSHVKDAFAWFWRAEESAQRVVMERASTAYFGLIVAVSVGLCFSVSYHFLSSSMSPGAQTPAVSQLSTSAMSTSAMTNPMTTSQKSLTTSSVDLVPRDEETSDDWLFGSRKVAVSFTPQAHGEVLIQGPDDAIKTWLAKGCLIVTATRGSHHIDTVMSSADEGILVKFPSREARGVVELSLQATCRPKAQKMVKVHFGKGVVEAAFDTTRKYILDLAELVPVVAGEARRYFGETKRSAEAASVYIGSNMWISSRDAWKKCQAAFSELHQSFGPTKSNIIDRVEDWKQVVTEQLDIFSTRAEQQVSQLRDAESRLRLTLLDAQVSAKMWWLKATGRTSEREEYQSKAGDFVAKAQATAEEKRRRRHHSAKSKTQAKGPHLWANMFGRDKTCSTPCKPGRRCPQQCRHKM